MHQESISYSAPLDLCCLVNASVIRAYGGAAPASRRLGMPRRSASMRGPARPGGAARLPETPQRTCLFRTPHFRSQPASDKLPPRVWDKRIRQVFVESKRERAENLYGRRSALRPATGVRIVRRDTPPDAVDKNQDMARAIGLDQVDLRKIWT